MPISDARWKAARMAALLGATLFTSPVFACTVTATGFQFGSIDPLVAMPATSTSTLSVTCPTATSYSIALSAGASGTFAERLMRSGANTLTYNLYSNPAYTVIWGDGTGGTDVVSGMAGSSGTTHTVYGRAPHQPTAIPGVYADSIIVTVTF